MVEGFSRHGGGSARICRQEGADRVEGRLRWWKVEDVVDSGGGGRTPDTEDPLSVTERGSSSVVGWSQSWRRRSSHRCSRPLMKEPDGLGEEDRGPPPPPPPLPPESLPPAEESLPEGPPVVAK